MPVYVDVALASPVRRLFTYQVPETLTSVPPVGSRVWVPFNGAVRIGLLVNQHTTTPEFDCKDLIGAIDQEPLVDENMLWLMRWVHLYYYCSLGEVIQAALPPGFALTGDLCYKPGMAPNANWDLPTKAIYDEIRESGRYPKLEAEKRWRAHTKSLKKLIKGGFIELWEDPKSIASTVTQTLWSATPQLFAEETFHRLDIYVHKSKPKWVQGLEHIMTLKLPLSTQQLNEKGISTPILKRLEQEGYLETSIVHRPFDVKIQVDPQAIKQLNSAQNEVLQPILEALNTQEYASFLLHGVTGSGKTEIYFHAIQQVLNAGKSALFLVPEIALTPQTIRRYAAVFGNNFAVIHSRLSERERLQAWRDLKTGRLNVVIGARSAIFAPVQNLGLIIVDEEHDTSYKQEDPAPRYHARDVAVMRAYHERAVIVMGSATPSLNAYQATLEGKSTLLKLNQRPYTTQQPKVHVLDLKQYRSAMRGPLAIPLYDAIQERIDRNEQMMLLYNRRGYASFVQCNACGHIPQCSSCAVSMTYHHSPKHLRCHYCGLSSSVVKRCPSCGASEGLDTKGSGTQQLEQQIMELFPEIAILRLDQDTSRGKHGFDTILGAFSRGEVQMLIGTQLLAKGLDFPNLTLVGVVNADTELAFPSYRSSERMFQLLTQVSGRPGRSSKAGEVYLQTMNPDHVAITMAKEHHYEGFIQYELPNRKLLSYPPFSRLIQLTFRGPNEMLVEQAACLWVALFKQSYPEIPVLGAVPSLIPKLRGMYRWEVQLKTDIRGYKETERMLSDMIQRYDAEKAKALNAVKLIVNVDVL
jgi:primosomal protein N' (replication factor Y)